MKDVREIVERLRPTVGRQAEALWALYLASDRNEQRELETTLRLLDLKHNATAPGNGPPGLPPPEPGVLDGWLRLGEVRYPSAPPAAFGLQPGELIQHVGIFGRSGAGKTNTVLVLLRELLRKDIPFLIFDWKRNYRDLLAAPWVPKGKVAAFTAGRDLAPIRGRRQVRSRGFG
jgi:DNA helicase HerA-like ATPase